MKSQRMSATRRILMNLWPTNWMYLRQRFIVWKDGMVRIPCRYSWIVKRTPYSEKNQNLSGLTDISREIDRTPVVGNVRAKRIRTSFSKKKEQVHSTQREHCRKLEKIANKLGRDQKIFYSSIRMNCQSSMVVVNMSVNEWRNYKNCTREWM